VFDLPYSFRDIDHWKSAMAGNPARAAEAAPPPGCESWATGSAVGERVWQRAINTKDDFGLKIRTSRRPPTSSSSALGAIPTPMAWPEVYLALQQRTVDAGETALPSMWDAKHYEVVKHVALTQHGLSTVAMLASEQRWKTYPPDVQAAIVKAAKEATDRQHMNYRKTRRRSSSSQGKGLSVATPDPVPFRGSRRRGLPRRSPIPCRRRSWRRSSAAAR
jgi:TRAP-type C4-dicarboxylate transport system substrate-binding protein